MHPKPMTPTSGPVLPNVVVCVLFSLSVTRVGRGLGGVFLIGDEVAPLGLRAVGLAEAFHMAMWVMKWSGAAPCQCHLLGGV